MSWCTSSNQILSDSKQVHENEIVPFCELIRNPKAYDGREIHTKAIFYVDRFSGYIYDPQCTKTNQLVGFESDEEHSANLNDKLAILNQPTSKGWARAGAKITGKFEINKDLSINSSSFYRYQILVSEVEDVEPVPDWTPLPWESELKQENKLLPFCQLVDHPKDYDEQQVHTQAIFYESKFRGFIYDPQCMRIDQLVSFEFDDKNSANLNKKLALLNEPSPRGFARARAIITGKFSTKKNKGLGPQNAYNHQIIISEIEDVKSVPDSVPVPWDVKGNE